MTMAVVVALVLTTLVGCSSNDDDQAAGDTTTVVTEPATTTTSTTEAPAEAGQAMYVYTPTVGDCFDRRQLEPEQAGPRVILLLDCELPHSFEVFGVVEFDDSALRPPSGASPGFPGQDALGADARLHCPPLFAQWVGLPYEVSELELSWVVPNEQSWANGSRTIGCTIYDPFTERLTGSTRDSRR
jgi:hypothetical protein